MRRIVHPTPHSARHLAVFTRHQPASTAACHRHAAAHRPIDSDSPRYLATCVTHAALAYTTRERSRGQQRQQSLSCARVDELPHPGHVSWSSAWICFKRVDLAHRARHEARHIRTRFDPGPMPLPCSRYWSHAISPLPPTEPRLRASTAYLSSRNNTLHLFALALLHIRLPSEHENPSGEAADLATPVASDKTP